MAAGIKDSQAIRALNQMAGVIVFESIDMNSIFNPLRRGALTIEIDQERTHLPLDGEVSVKVSAQRAFTDTAFLVADKNLESRRPARFQSLAPPPKGYGSPDFSGKTGCPRILSW